MITKDQLLWNYDVVKLFVETYEKEANWLFYLMEQGNDFEIPERIQRFDSWVVNPYIVDDMFLVLTEKKTIDDFIQDWFHGSVEMLKLKEQREKEILERAK